MTVYCVSYDLNSPGQKYTELHDELRKKDHRHDLTSTWLVDTSENAQQLYDRLAPHLDDNDYILVIRVTRDYQGLLPKEAWAWINSRV